MAFKFLTSFIATAVAALLTLTSCSAKSSGNKNSNSEKPENTDAVVCYYSATGNTAVAAKRLADLIGADLIEIEPEQVYTTADLNWRDSTSRSSVEMHDPASRPALKNPGADLSKYRVVFIGYPNWWNTAPRIINSFIESVDLKNKVVVPFMTSGGSSIEQSEKDLSAAYPSIKWGNGLLMNDVTDRQILDWASMVEAEL